MKLSFRQRFKPERASQAISPNEGRRESEQSAEEFQTRTGFPGHFALASFTLIIPVILFQTRTGFPGHFAFFSGWDIRLVLVFQTRTGFPGHFACGTHSIAWEATLCNTLRGSLFSGVFYEQKARRREPHSHQAPSGAMRGSTLREAITATRAQWLRLHDKDMGFAWWWPTGNRTARCPLTSQLLKYLIHFTAASCRIDGNT